MDKHNETHKTEDKEKMKDMNLDKEKDLTKTPEDLNEEKAYIPDDVKNEGIKEEIKNEAKDKVKFDENLRSKNNDFVNDEAKANVIKQATNTKRQG